MPGPLDGIRVLELPALGPVPFVGMLLADLGADVVRVDRLPVAPGSAAGAGAAAGAAEDTADLATALTAGPLGRGRSSIALDLRRPGAAEVVLRLTERCDALIEGFRPGVAERLGVGPDAVRARNPRLVYGRMTGWGQDGPLASTAGHDITYLAVSGLLAGIGPAERPVPPVNYLADFGGGALVLATGLLAALLSARVTGQGQVVDAAMVEGAAYLGSMTRVLSAAGRWTDRRADNLLDGGAPNYRCYECADGRFVAVGALEPRFWTVLVEALGLDPATVPSPYDRDRWGACADLLAATFRTRTRDEWAALLEPLDACTAPVLTPDEAPRHDHNAARGSFVAVGGVTVAAPVPRFALTPAAAAAPTRVGDATDRLLAEVGYDEAQVHRLHAAGVIDSGPAGEETVQQYGDEIAAREVQRATGHTAKQT